MNIISKIFTLCIICIIVKSKMPESRRNFGKNSLNNIKNYCSYNAYNISNISANIANMTNCKSIFQKYNDKSFYYNKDFKHVCIKNIDKFKDYIIIRDNCIYNMNSISYSIIIGVLSWISIPLFCCQYIYI